MVCYFPVFLVHCFPDNGREAEADKVFVEDKVFAADMDAAEGKEDMAGSRPVAMAGFD